MLLHKRRAAASQIKSNYVASNYAKTKYPLVFAHGMGGWIRAGTDELGVDYWYQILPDLARNGANPWATRVSPFNTSEVRGEQLLCNKLMRNLSDYRSTQSEFAW